MKWLALIYLFFLHSNLVYANQCLELFAAHDITHSKRSNSFTIQKPTAEQLTWMRSSLSESTIVKPIEPTVNIEVANKEMQNQGQFLIVTKMEGRPWPSKGKIHPNAPQGDPRWPFQILGSEVAVVLGFDMPNANTVILPTVARINWGIDQLNRVLAARNQEEIPYSFYEQRNTVDTQYSELAVLGKIPISAIRETDTDIIHGNLVTVHDMTFHLTMIVEPPQIAQMRKITIEILDKYIDFATLADVRGGAQKAENLIDVSLASVTLTAGALEHITRRRDPFTIYLEANYFIAIDPMAALQFVPSFISFQIQNRAWLTKKVEEHKNLQTDAGYTADTITVLTLQRRRELAAAARILLNN